MPAPIAIFLNSRDELRLSRLALERGRPAKRAEALLMLSRGETISRVAGALGVCPNTITGWKKRWLQGRVSRLSDARRPGRPRKVTPRYLKLLKQALASGPSLCGVKLENWSAKGLAEHLERETGVRICAKQLRAWAAKAGCQWYSAPATHRALASPRDILDRARRSGRPQVIDDGTSSPAERDWMHLRVFWSSSQPSTADLLIPSDPMGELPMRQMLALVAAMPDAAFLAALKRRSWSPNT